MATLTWDAKKKRWRLNWIDGSALSKIRRREFYHKNQQKIASERLDVLKEYEARTKRGLQAAYPKSFAAFVLDYDAGYLVAKSFIHRDRELKRLKTNLLPFFGPMELGKIDGSHIRDYLAQRRRDGMSNKTMRNELTTLSSVLNYAMDLSYLSENPVRKINQRKILPKLPTRVGRYVSDVELSKFLECASYECAAIVIVLRQTGLRVGELFPKNVSLSRERFDVERKILDLSHTIDTPLKGKEDRFIPLTDPVLLIVTCVKSGPIFKMNRHGFKSAFYKALRSSKMDFTPHDLRHTFVSVLADSGMDTKTISTISGHSSVYIMARYLHQIRKDADVIREKMEKALAWHPQGTTFYKHTELLEKNVETRGIEPLTSCMPCRRSPS